MKTLIPTLAAMACICGLLAEEPKPKETRAAPTSELFMDELRAARDLRAEWNTRDDELDAARNGGSLSDPELYKRIRAQIDAVLKAKHSELEAWTAYYQKTADYWQSILKTIQGSQPARATERQDLSNMLVTERRERDDVRRRQHDLLQTLQDKGVSTDQPAAVDLKKLLALKEDNIATLERAIQEFDLGVTHLDKRRDLARSRSLQARQLLHSVDVERPLWDAVYNGTLHRVDLEYDSKVPEPEGRPDWRNKLGGTRGANGAGGGAK
jgi:hypothetical protein